VERGRLSNVPMQPRRERIDVRGETVFQVTKRGLSVMVMLRWEVRRTLIPMGVKEPVEPVGGKTG
jgi:hypothetical protein